MQLKLNSNGPQVFGCGVSTSIEFTIGDWWNYADACDIGYGPLKRTQQRPTHAEQQTSYSH
jgi:hypothetical protein